MKTFARSALITISGSCLLLAGCNRFMPKPVPPADSYQGQTFDFQYGSSSLRVPGAVVTSAFFLSGKITPSLGRTFLPQEFGSKGAPVVLLSFRFWREQFGGDPSVIAKTVQVNGRPLTVVGVVPAEFDVPAGASLWIPKTS